jgi:hypothetical protein
VLVGGADDAGARVMDQGEVLEVGEDRGRRGRGFGPGPCRSRKSTGGSGTGYLLDIDEPTDDEELRQS